MDTTASKILLAKIMNSKIWMGVFTYFAGLVAFIALLLLLGVPLTSGEGGAAFPSIWILLLWLAYYLAPAIVSIFFSFDKGRVSWKQWAFVCVAIFIVHLAYSASISLVRELYVMEWQEKVHIEKETRIAGATLSMEYTDKNEDSLLDVLDVKVRFKSTTAQEGVYGLQLKASKGDKALANAYKEVSFKKGEAEVVLSIPVESIKFGPYSVNMSFILQRQVEPDERQEVIMNMCRWAAFFCPVGMTSSSDPEIYSDVLTLQYDTMPFMIPELSKDKTQQDFVKVLKVGPAFKDKRLDYIIIPIKVDSIYEGNLYFYAQERNKWSVHKAQVQKGVNELEFLLTSASDLNDVKDLRLEQFYFDNVDLECQDRLETKCKREEGPSFVNRMCSSPDNCEKIISGYGGAE